MPVPKVTLSDTQREAFKKLWFIYGNGGAKATMQNHKLVQGFYEHSENRIEAYKIGMTNMNERFGEEYALKNGITEECVSACEKILTKEQ